VLLSPPKPQERFARIARGAPVNEPNYELSIMGLPEPDRSQE
jgi:hypothetical protein